MLGALRFVERIGVSKARAHVIISGRVQGVFFRDTMRGLANQYGVTGWVRNLLDGRVEAIIEGDVERVNRLLEWCRIGPPAARVEAVDVEWGEYRGEFSEFFIRR